MKKLFLFFLFVLTTCAAIEESFDDHIILEKSKENSIASLIKPKIRQTTGVTTRHITRYTTLITTMHSYNAQTPIPRKTKMKNSLIKGIDYFTGKLGKEFRKLKDSVKKAIAKLIKNNKWKSFLKKGSFNLGSAEEPYHGPCENLSRKDCEQLMNFAKYASKYS